MLHIHTCIQIYAWQTRKIASPTLAHLRNWTFMCRCVPCEIFAEEMVKANQHHISLSICLYCFQSMSTWLLKINPNIILCKRTCCTSMVLINFPHQYFIIDTSLGFYRFRVANLVTIYITSSSFMVSMVPICWKYWMLPIVYNRWFISIWSSHIQWWRWQFFILSPGRFRSKLVLFKNNVGFE